MPGRPLILGHRGAPHSAPENSLESFRIALAAGADGIELDVQITGDGVLVAHHDGSLPSGEKLS
ncbi:glycerophosphodiester phosphodiesterase [bacterium]|nr:glycerophosphodiester phosphodiesterase [bacterium]